jgi:single-strand DNA-binding protein
MLLKRRILPQCKTLLHEENKLNSFSSCDILRTYKPISEHLKGVNNMARNSEVRQTISGGNLGGDPTLRYTPSGAAVVNFNVGQTPREKTANGEWQDGETIWTPCTAWNDLAENIAETLTKGTRVIVTGTVKARSFTTKEGEKRTVQELTVEDIGPSLAYAKATVTRNERKNNGGNTQSSASAAQASQSQNNASSFADEPPF